MAISIVTLDTCVNTCTCVYTIWWHHCSGSFSNGFEEYGTHALVMCCPLYKPLVIKKIQLLHRGSYMYMCVPSASPPTCLSHRFFYRKWIHFPPVGLTLLLLIALPRDTWEALLAMSLLGNPKLGISTEFKGNNMKVLWRCTAVIIHAYALPCSYRHNML